MKRKTSNIIITILVAVVVFCGIMAAGTFGGWFGQKDEPVTSEHTVTQDTAQNEESGTDEELQSQIYEESATKADSREKSASTCTISIKCDSILKNMDKLSEGKAKYVPSNGTILAKSTVEFKEGYSVYDVLKATCSAAGINLSAKNSSMGIYVEGINNIFEFDCGGTSGWMYSVNGTAPNHSSSQHKVKDGDNIVWYYTCGN